MVVLFHFGIATFQSGFLGVDVFFVISGYLMAKLYIKGEASQFFARRAKRLLPAYYATIVLTLAAASVLTVPSDFNQVRDQGIFALFFSSNIGFWLQNSYFSKAEFNPLLHLWSLGVEIQFYLFVPLVALIFRKRKILFTLCLVGSLILCLAALTISPKTSFFMMPLRVWEFLFGYWVANISLQFSRIQNREKLGWICFLILFAIPLIPVDGRALSILIGHPGLFALAIVLTTALALSVGLPESLIASKAGKALEKIGTYSYSIYLVHFPVIILGNYEPFNGTILATNSWLTSVTFFLIVCIFSYLSYQYIERKKWPPPRTILLAGTGSIVCVISISNLIQDNRFSPEQKKIFFAWEDRAPYRCGKIFRAIQPTKQVCPLGKTNDTLDSILLVGNSHADAIKTTFDEVARENGYQTYFYVSNNPLMDNSSIKPEHVIQEAKLTNSKQIVLHYAPKSIQVDTIFQLSKLSEDAGITVSFIMPVPVYQVHIPKQAYLESIGASKIPSQTIEQYNKYNEELISNLAATTNVRVINTSNIFCSPKCKTKDKNGNLFYFDAGHMTLTGAALLKPALQNLFSVNDSAM